MWAFLEGNVLELYAQKLAVLDLKADDVVVDVVEHLRELVMAVLGYIGKPACERASIS
jgi:hypothetical protein